ncbi:MAG: CPBP family intramembrane glutamic endopeptidase [Ignavibacteriaceae bacterium]
MNEKVLNHTLLKSIILHLFPGIITGLAYFLLVPVVNELGYPSVIALIIAGIIALVPFEFGVLYYQKKRTGKSFFNGVIKYCKPIPLWQYFLWIPIIFLSAGIIFSVFNNLNLDINELFSWIPDEYILGNGLTNEYTKQKLLITYSLFFVFIVIVFPVIEELYFRGYLLPRMPAKLGGFTTISHSALFALYHTWTPWLFVTRTLAVFPLIFIVKRKENIWVGIIAHCLLNSLDFFMGIAFISNIS